ncbi:hypothetical protein AcV7_002728 [Taiwanofungus camphoratus]|nr:hypothetical protein AcV7_002728 [Antrodia cinnamomea]
MSQSRALEGGEAFWAPRAPPARSQRSQLSDHNRIQVDHQFTTPAISSNAISSIFSPSDGFLSAINYQHDHQTGDNASFNGGVSTTSSVLSAAPMCSNGESRPASGSKEWKGPFSAFKFDPVDVSKSLSEIAFRSPISMLPIPLFPTAAQSQPSVALTPQPEDAKLGSSSSSMTATSPDGPSPVTDHLNGGIHPRRVEVIENGIKSYDWMEMLHLDGSIYYWDQKRRVVTPDDIRQSDIRNALVMAVNNLRLHMYYSGQAPGKYMTGEEDLIVKGAGIPSGPTMFFLNHEKCWYIEPIWRGTLDIMQEFSFPSGGIRKTYRPFDLRLEERTGRYWSELESFPMHLPRLSSVAEAEFLGALTYGANERILQWTETPFPLSEHQAERLMQVYRDTTDAAADGRLMAPAQAWLIARTMKRIEVSRRESKHGTRDAQLYRPVVVAPPTWRVKAADVALAPVLFGVQRMYRVRLEGVRVKGVMYEPDLRDLFENFLAEWSDSNLLATVFIGANIGFLAIADITSMQRTALLASSVFAVTSVVSGVHHVWQHRTKVDASPEEAQEYMSDEESTGKDEHLEVMACFLSIPVAALLWSILSFTIALGAFCIQNTVVQGKVLLAVALGIVGLLSLATLLFFWHIWRGPRRVEIGDQEVQVENARGWVDSFRRLFREVRDIVRGRKSDESDWMDTRSGKRARVTRG